MATTYTDVLTMSNLPDAIRAIYSSELEFTAQALTTFDDPSFVEVKDDFQAEKGQTVTWTIYHQLPPSIGTLTENTDVDGGKMSDFQVSFSVNEYGYAIGTTEKLDLLSYHGPISSISKDLLAPQMAVSMDLLSRNVYYGSGANTYARWFPSTVTARTGLDATNTAHRMSADIVKKGAYRLGVRRIPPIGGAYVCKCHDALLYDLRGDSLWKDANLYAGAVRLFNGEEGMLHGVRFVKADLARLPNGGTTSQTQTTLNGAISVGATYATVVTSAGFAAGDEVTIHADSATPDGTDATEEHLVVDTVPTGTRINFKTKIQRDHATGVYVTKGTTVFPALFQGGTKPMGKGVVILPEVRVAPPTDKLRRISYVGWYALLGFGILRNWAYDLVELTASQTSAPAFQF